MMTELADFELHPRDHPRHKLVHGSFLTQAHFNLRTNAGRVVRVSVWASMISQQRRPNGTPVNLGWANGTVDSEPAFELQAPRNRIKEVDDVRLQMDFSSLHVFTREFEIIVTPHHFRLERNVVGLHHHLDITFKLRIDEEEFGVWPHGIIGQAWDGDGMPINGELDEYPESGEFTTKAMAKGAIEGVPNDYKVRSPYATEFKFSRFDASESALEYVSEEDGMLHFSRRDVVSLVSEGVLNMPGQTSADVSAADIGTSENTEEHL